MNVITNFYQVFLYGELKARCDLLSRLRETKVMFAIKDAEECVVKVYVWVWVQEEVFESPCLPENKTPPHVFQLALKVDFHSGRKELKTDNVASVLASCSLENQQLCVMGNLLYPIPDFFLSIFHFLCLQSQMRMTHWILFSL
ncbi:hypothetical protein XENORESO_000124 [Xenotaenia resolanae]|uniref:Uncharacterized protein n=1 Tax=Xenotaenia resolanae TaxID=208358 RepID=A0ABV0W036_9TELE